jgi:hypothetical protein
VFVSWASEARSLEGEGKKGQEGSMGNRETWAIFELPGRARMSQEVPRHIEGRRKA